MCVCGLNEGGGKAQCVLGEAVGDKGGHECKTATSAKNLWLIVKLDFSLSQNC